MAKRRKRTTKKRRAPARRRRNAAGFLNSPQARFGMAAVGGAVAATALSQVPQISEFGAALPGGSATVSAAILAGVAMVSRGRTKSMLQAAAMGALGVGVVAMVQDGWEMPKMPKLTGTAATTRVYLPQSTAPSSAVNDFLKNNRTANTIPI